MKSVRGRIKRNNWVLCTDYSQVTLLSILGPHCSKQNDSIRSNNNNNYYSLASIVPAMFYIHINVSFNLSSFLSLHPFHPLLCIFQRITEGSSMACAIASRSLPFLWLWTTLYRRDCVLLEKRHELIHRLMKRACSGPLGFAKVDRLLCRRWPPIDH